MHKHILVSRDLFPFQLESRFAITHSHVSSGHHRFPTAHNCKSGDLNDRIIFDCSVCSGRIFKAPGISKDDTVSKRDITLLLLRSYHRLPTSDSPIDSLNVISNRSVVTIYIPLHSKELKHHVVLRDVLKVIL